MLPISQHLKCVANELANAALSEQGSQLFGKLRTLLKIACDEPSSSPYISLRNPSRIGIWEPENFNDEWRFVRPPEPKEMTSLWADVEVIEPKSRRKRIVLIGESVARGFFFDPHFNPAMVLQNILREASGDNDYEVIDLARTNLIMDQLLELAAAAVQLAPDAVVVFAGNNWHPTFGLKPAHFQELSGCLRSGNWGDVKIHLEGLLRDQARAAIDTLCGLAQANSFKLLFVCPEFNLGDWRTDAVSPPLLDSSTTAKWRSARAAGERALVEGDLPRAEVMGTELIKLDNGTTAVGFNLLAEVKLRNGELVDARKYLEAARDSAICWPNGPDSPRCFTVVQAVLRNEAMKGRFFLVDLPLVLQDQLKGILPGRQVFLDYCHFTVHGTHIAMAAVAQVALATVHERHFTLNDLNTIKLAVDPRVEGESHLLAGVHNANWGQGVDIVSMHFGKALELSPSLYNMLDLLLDFHSRHIPSSLCKSFYEFCKMGGSSAVALFFNSFEPTTKNFLNPMLIDAVADAQDAHSLRTKYDRPAIDNLLCKEHRLDCRNINLLNKVYSEESYLLPLNQAARAFYRAVEPISRFKLVCDKSDALRLRITYRTRWDSSDQHVSIRVRSHEVGRAPLSRTWTTATFTVAPEVLSSGLNFLEIYWPAPQWDLPSWKDQVVGELDAAIVPEVCPVYGEIHSLLGAVGEECC